MTKLTKQHFEAIANIINKHYNLARQQGDHNTKMVLGIIVGELGDYFAETNPLFNTIMFYERCYKEI